MSMTDDSSWDVGSADQPGDFLEAAEIAVSSASADARLRAVAVLRDRLPDLERDAVMQAVAAGAQWARIADALGRSRQAVHAKYAVRQERKAPPSRHVVEARAERARLNHWLAEQLERRQRRTR